jgi:GT2 family glycosyltransferase
MMEHAAPKLSIIVPVKDDERIFGLLTRLSESPELTSCEVIIACNGSRKEFSDRISSALAVFPLARALTDQVANPARAINTAARVAAGEKLLILDSDCVPCSGYLQSILAPLSANAVARGQITYVGTDAFSRTTAAWRQCFYDRVAKEGRLYAPNLAIDRGLFLSLGGFVESLRHAYDSEFSDRAMRSGKSAVLLPAATVTHECHTSVVTEMKIWFDYGCGRHYRMNGMRNTKAVWHALFGDLPLRIILSNPRHLTYAFAYVPVRAAGFVYTAVQKLVA